MKAMVYREYGGLDVLEYCDVPRPEPGPNEVLVRVRSCSINRGQDIETRELGYMRPPLPHIGGVDPAGDVVEVGTGAEDFQPGDRVGTSPLLACGRCRYCLAGQINLCLSIRLFGTHTDGGYAEYAAIPKSCLVRLPDNISYDEAACYGLAYPTAWHLLVSRAQVGPSDTVLVLAAGSGVGVAGIQICKLFGARVIATASTQEKLDMARNLGADEVINYAQEDFGLVAREMTGGMGVDVVFENVGSATWDQSIASMAKGARLVTCGITSGGSASIDIRSLYFREISLLFSVGAVMSEAHQVYAMAAAGKLKAVIDTTYPLSELKEAQQRILDRAQFGKVIINP